MAAAQPIVDATPFSGRPGLTQGTRLLALLNASERNVRREFIRLIGRARGIRTLEQIAQLLEAGLIDEALDVMDEAMPAFASAIEEAYAAAGASTAGVIRRNTRSLIEFDRSSGRAVAFTRAERLRLVQQLTGSARETLRGEMQRGLALGERPDRIARRFRQSLGLTEHQAQAVENFRQALINRDRSALDRSLRDRRFDPTIRRAIASDTALSSQQIERMTQRYRERFLVHRANTIARTEALRAIHAGDEVMWQQAVDNGTVQPEDITTRWVTASDERVRGSHSAMNGQEQPFGESFRSGSGNSLRFPGDPSAPGSDTINCRCVLDRTIPPKNPRAFSSQ